MLGVWVGGGSATGSRSPNFSPLIFSLICNTTSNHILCKRHFLIQGVGGWFQRFRIFESGVCPDCVRFLPSRPDQHFLQMKWYFCIKTFFCHMPSAECSGTCKWWKWCLWKKVKSENLVFLKLVICQNEHIWKAKALGNLFELQFWQQYKCYNWFPL